MDVKAKKEVFQLLKALSQNKLVIFISHDILNVEHYADQVWLVQNKKIEMLNNLENLEQYFE